MYVACCMLRGVRCYMSYVLCVVCCLLCGVCVCDVAVYVRCVAWCVVYAM